MKKNNGLITALISLIFVFLVVDGAIIYYKYVDTDNTSNEENIDNSSLKDENTKLSMEEIDVLMNTIDNLNRLDKYNKNELRLADIDNQMKLDIALILATTDEYKLYDESYTLSDINRISNKYFGSNIETEDFVCDYDDKVMYKFDESSKEYIYDENHPGHRTTIIETVNLYLDSSKKIDTYTITVKKAFGEDDYSVSKNFYANYEDAVMRENSVFYVETSEDQNVKKDYKEGTEKNKQNLKKFTYTFKKKNANYIFESVVKE